MFTNQLNLNVMENKDFNKILRMIYCTGIIIIGYGYLTDKVKDEFDYPFMNGTIFFICMILMVVVLSLFTKSEKD